MNYKKIIALICSVSIVISLTACGDSNGNEDTIGSVSDDITTTAAELKTTTEETTTEAPEPVFEACPYAELNFVNFTREPVYTISGWTMFLKNNTDKPITNMKVAIMCFDENFLPTTEKPIEKEFSPNLMGNESNTYSDAQIGQDADFETNGDYFVGVITYVKFRDGSDWTAENLDIWTDDVYKNFDLDDWLKIRETLKEDAKKAEKNEYLDNVTGIYIFDPDWDYKDKYAISWNHPDNLSADNIIEYNINVIYYDKNGKYLNYQSARVTEDYFNDSVGHFGTYTEDGITPENVGYTKNIIYSITFKDGTVWLNPYSTAWKYYNSYDLDLKK